EAGISPEVIALVPEAVARENVLLPFFATKNAIKILFAELPDIDLGVKLNYILRREIHPALASRAAILAAIDQLLRVQRQPEPSWRTCVLQRPRSPTPPLTSFRRHSRHAKSSDSPLACGLAELTALLRR